MLKLEIKKLGGALQVATATCSTTQFELLLTIQRVGFSS